MINCKKRRILVSKGFFVFRQFATNSGDLAAEAVENGVVLLVHVLQNLFLFHFILCLNKDLIFLGFVIVKRLQLNRLQRLDPYLIQIGLCQLLIVLCKAVLRNFARKFIVLCNFH